MPYALYEARTQDFPYLVFIFIFPNLPINIAHINSINDAQKSINAAGGESVLGMV